MTTQCMHPMLLFVCKCVCWPDFVSFSHPSTLGTQLYIGPIRRLTPLCTVRMLSPPPHHFSSLYVGCAWGFGGASVTLFAGTATISFFYILMYVWNQQMDYFNHWLNLIKFCTIWKLKFILLIRFFIFKSKLILFPKSVINISLVRSKLLYWVAWNNYILHYISLGTESLKRGCLNPLIHVLTRKVWKLHPPISKGDAQNMSLLLSVLIHHFLLQWITFSIYHQGWRPSCVETHLVTYATA